MELAAAAGLGFAVDLDVVAGEEDLGVRAGVDDAGQLEELAEARVYEFLLVVPPLKIRGGTGSALRSFALVPGQAD